MDRDTEFLFLRATPLVFGVFGAGGVAGERVVRVGGSGIFVAPFMAVTASHVSRDLLRMDWRGEHPPNKGFFETEHSSALFQIPNLFGANPNLAIWRVHQMWDTTLTDLSLMHVSAHSGAALDMQKQMPTGFFEWALLPPPIGSQVVMLGYPKTEITPFDEKIYIDTNLVWQVGHVSEIHELRRDRGKLNFPCFHIDQPVDSGFSGGPVFWGERLCGIVSSDSFYGGTYAATLWPLCLMEYECPGLGGLGGKTTVGDLFESRVLHSREWSTLKRRISRRHNENGRLYAHIEDEAT